MCGILFGVGKNLDLETWISENKKRGPDAFDSIHFNELSFYGFVLHLRGNQITKQPYQENKNILLFNGEVYNGIDMNSSSSDTLQLSNLLNQTQSEEAILKVWSSMQGEWAFVYYHHTLNCVYFGRDGLGKRSLLIHHTETEFILSSVSSTQDSLDFWAEVSTQGLFKLDLATKKVTMLEWNGYPGLFRFDYSLEMQVPTEKDLEPIIDTNQLPKLSHYQYYIDQTLSTLSESVSIRCSTVPSPKKGARLAILFSGGLDCMLLAILAHQYIPPNEPIDLLNVSFQNPRTGVGFDVPDRLTGLQGYKELKQLNREWRFVKVDVSCEEYLDKKEYVRGLMNPTDTVMDLSIAIAFWFAGRGIGTLYDHTVDGESGKEYKSEARVLFSGLGADEQCGGYSRHRTAFEQGSWAKLVQEMNLDVSRISHRNMGRDDRILSSHGKEVRFPFLDENVVRYLSSIPVWVKTDPRYARHIGDKMLLRMISKQLGFDRASIEPKRAVQFGARTAKMENKQKGHVKLE